jgi:hypothetical protein
LSAILRVGWPTLTEFKFSEARLEALALELTREGRLPLVGVPSSAGFDHSPVSVYLYAPAFLFTTSPIPATIYGGLVGVGTVAVCWRFARRWPGGGSAAAVTAAAMLATSPWAVSFSRKIWQVAFVPILSLILVGLAVALFCPGERARTVGKSGRHLVWLVVTYALLVQVHPSAVSLAPALALWLILFRRSVKPGYLVLGALLGLLTGLPMLVHQVKSGWPAWTALRALPQADWDLSAVRLSWEMITGRGIHALVGDAYPLLGIEPRLAWTFNLVGWFTLGACALLVWRTVRNWSAKDLNAWRSARVDFILLSWLAVGVLFNLRHSLELHLHFFALLSPVAFLILGRGLQAIVTVPPRSMKEADVFHPPGRTLAVVVGLVLTCFAVAQVSMLVLLGRFLASHEVTGGFGTPLARYLEVAEQVSERAQATGASEVLVVGLGDSVVVHEGPAIFDILLRAGATRYRFVDGDTAAVFPPHPSIVLLRPGAGEAERWYAAWTPELIAGGYRLLSLDGSWPAGDVEPVQGQRLFENGIEVQGYSWEVDSGRAEFWALWQVLWLQPDDTHFFVHVKDEEGSLLGQGDAAGYPVHYRRRGDRVLSRFDIDVDRGTVVEHLSARVGLYYYPQVKNLRVLDSEGNPAADAIVLDLVDRSE